MCGVYGEDYDPKKRLHVVRIIQRISALKNKHHLETLLRSKRSSPYKSHMNFARVMPYSPQNRTTLHCCSSHVDDSNMHAIFVA